MTKPAPFTQAGLKRAIRAARDSGLHVVGIGADGALRFGQTEQPVAPSAAPEFVYVIEAGQFLKIGYSRNVEARLQALQSNSPIPMKIVATMIGDRATEKLLHARFAHLRIKGEWFRRGHEIERWVAAGCRL